MPPARGPGCLRQRLEPPVTGVARLDRAGRSNGGGKAPIQSGSARLGASPLSAESWPWYKGALGEIAVGRVLAGLGPEWLVLHAVPVGAGTTDIDHGLVGPAGVFTINTKNHSGQPVWVAGWTLMVAGTKTRHLRNAAHEAARASKVLSAAVGAPVDVAGIVVIVQPKSLTVKEKPEVVAVMTERQLLGWLNRRSRRLAPEDVGRIASEAVLARTWHRSPAEPGDTHALRQEFGALRLLVNQARRRRAAWTLGVPAAVFLTLTNGAHWGAAALHLLKDDEPSGEGRNVWSEDRSGGRWETTL